MTRAWKNLEKLLEWCGALLVILVGVPLVALGLFVLRSLIFAVAVAALIGSLALYCAYPRFRHWADLHTRPTRLKVR